MYGNPSKVPIDETHPLNACSPYGRTKLIIEDMFRDLAASPEGKEWRIILLRYFNPVGAHPSGVQHKPSNFVLEPHVVPASSAARLEQQASSDSHSS